jgi:hypothetical protein
MEPAGMSTRTRSRTEQARQKAADARRDAQRREQRRRGITIGGIGVLVAAAVTGIAIAATHAGGGTPVPTGPVTTGDPGAAAASMPPWRAPTDVNARVQAAGLGGLGPMGTADHYHAHLDVIVNGAKIPVVADIGVDAASGQMSGLHTHDTSGVIHIEAATKGQSFTLGQLFTEWNVRLTPTAIGGLTSGAGKTISVYVNGKRVPGDPAVVVFRPFQEVALVYGPTSQHVDIPKSFNFSG